MSPLPDRPRRFSAARVAVTGVLAGAVVLVFVLVRDVARRGTFAAPLSTYSSEPNGTRALYLLAERLGLGPRRWTEDLGRLPPGGVFVLPSARRRSSYRRLERRERRNLERWVRAGGTLVLLGVSPDHARGFGVTLDLSDKAGKPRSWFDDRAAPAGFVEAAHKSESLHPLTEGLSHARFRAPDAMRSTEPQALVLMESEDGRTLVLEHPHGRGRVVALASASPATNGELGWGDHAPLMARLLALATSPVPAARGTPRVYFDEYHAGVGRRRSITGYLAQHGWFWPALQLGLFVAALLARGAASFGVPRPDPPAPPDDASTFVEGIGRIYERSRDVGGAAERLAKEAVGRLASSHALGPSIDPVALERELRQRGRTAAADVVGVAMLRASQLKSHPSPRVADLVGFARWLDAAVRQALEAHKQLGARANAAGDLSRLQSRRNA